MPGLPVRRLAIHAAVPDGLAAAALLGSLGDAAVGEGFGRRRIGGGYSAAAAGLVALGRRGGGCCLLLPSNGLHLLDVCTCVKSISFGLEVPAHRLGQVLVDTVAKEVHEIVGWQGGGGLA